MNVQWKHDEEFTEIVGITIVFLCNNFCITKPVTLMTINSLKSCVRINMMASVVRIQVMVHNHVDVCILRQSSADTFEAHLHTLCIGRETPNNLR